VAVIARSTKLTRGERRESLLDAATELLGAGGPGAVTMEGVAAAAGVTKALPYRHFPNADAVLVALVERFNLELAECILPRRGAPWSRSGTAGPDPGDPGRRRSATERR
jgi:AcrR family transcriptional regulator